MAWQIAPQAKAYGVVGPILHILESFLQERSLKVVLDGMTSPLISPMLGPTLFLVFINDLPSEVLSKIGIYADDTTVHSSLVNSVFFEKVELADELEVYLYSIVEWDGRWLVTFNATKTKLLFFNHHIDPLLVPVEMNGIELPEDNSFRLLDLTFTQSID